MRPALLTDGERKTYLKAVSRNKEAFERVGYSYIISRLMQSGYAYNAARHVLLEDALSQLSIENAS